MIVNDLNSDNLTEIFAVVALAVALVCAIVLIAVYVRRLRAVVAKAAADNVCELPSADAAWPSVAVMVYACDNSAALQRMLPDVLSQQYPGRMEVIVVNDGSSAEVSDIVEGLAVAHKNLRLTFIPDEAHNLSRKKLAITLGVKAARTDCVMLTEADCTIPSSEWLSRMCRHFIDGKDVVLGNVIISDLRGQMARLDYDSESAWFFASAILGTPYRGYGMNLAYHRSVFFDHKGFAKSLNLHAGDDDLFISEITDKTNTAVELSAASTLALVDPKPELLYRDLRLSHMFTALFGRRHARRLMGFCSCLMWLWLAATAVSAVFAWPNPIVLSALGVIAIGLWTFVSVVWSKLATALGTRVNLLTLIPLLFWRPIRNRYWRHLSRKTERRNFTWLQTR